jgi:prophage regulatory protein
MRPLPTKTTAPIRIAAIEHHGASNGRAYPEPKTASVERNEGPALAPPLKLLRFGAVQARIGLSRSTIWRLERRGQFPRHRRISANAVAWVEDELVAWIRAKVDVAI